MAVNRGVYDEAAPLYKALARASLKAREDPDWAYVRDRLDEVTGSYEELIRLEKSLGWRNYEKYSVTVNRLASLDERWLVLEEMLNFEEDLRRDLAAARVAYNYTLKTRAASFTALLLAAILAAYHASSLELLLASLTATGLALAGLLLLLHRLAPVPVIIGDAILLFSAFSTTLPSTTILSILIAVIATVLASPLPAALYRMITPRGSRVAGRRL